MLLTRQLLDPFDFHSIFFPTMGVSGCLSGYYSLANILFCVQQNLKTNTCLEQLECE